MIQVVVLSKDARLEEALRAAGLKVGRVDDEGLGRLSKRSLSGGVGHRCSRAAATAARTDHVSKATRRDRCDPRRVHARSAADAGSDAGRRQRVRAGARHAGSARPGGAPGDCRRDSTGNRSGLRVRRREGRRGHDDARRQHRHHPGPRRRGRRAAHGPARRTRRCGDLSRRRAPFLSDRRARDTWTAWTNPSFAASSRRRKPESICSDRPTV